MLPFTVHNGVCAALLQANIDTDAIIPSREMKRVSKLGLGEGLFAAWRYTLPGGREPNPDFILNRPEYRDTSILIGGENFGCGSSREHAVWALAEYGIRAIVAPGFGSIFRNNCIGNGILPVELPAAALDAIVKWTGANPQSHQLTVDLEALELRFDTRRLPFTIGSAAREQLLTGRDAIDLTLGHNAQIEAFEQQDRLRRPWAYL